MSRRDQRYRRWMSDKCCECRTTLSHWYYEKEGQLFCKRDYWARFGELCNGCTETISTGLIMANSRLTSAALVPPCVRSADPAGSRSRERALRTRTDPSSVLRAHGQAWLYNRL
ncbi:hypothetical protein COCON_G00072450 [Conger conger]|uniref:LIM zinc-binding domain-containing protein n=1 Tax=Conger conger TaxID=82655 RepID=A0A9Q1DN28_CONCO|nr:hypothetical protein COCON_G00072450 [Conger conger]